ncbi:MAG: 2-amino-4-hydroxy-6-hydroxymethyldihydropteridine diphosphokinase [Bdellovibrionales bacterium]|nr:2-amino-4-hydroxy-6-hydroxymethyldihydropteridine diphosphokinase [Bdellovibrionales bacterium]
MIKPTMYIALIGLKVFSNDGISLCRDVMKDLLKKVDVQKVSSIYRVKRSQRHPQHTHDLRTVMDFEGLSLALKVTTGLSPVQLMTFILEVEKKNKSEVLHRSLSLNLLAYEDQTLMTEFLTLPHPLFHAKPEMVFPAAEVWGEYFHPVLQKNLHAITRDFADLRWGEFFDQGKTILDF